MVCNSSLAAKCLMLSDLHDIKTDWRWAPKVMEYNLKMTGVCYVNHNTENMCYICRNREKFTFYLFSNNSSVAFQKV